MLCQSCVEHGVEVVRERRFHGRFTVSKLRRGLVRFVSRLNVEASVEAGALDAAPYGVISVLFITSFSVL